MKQGIKFFEKYLARIASKVKQVEKDGITVEPSIKDAVSKAQDMIRLVKEATTFDQIKDSAEAMPEIAQILNDALPKLEQLAQLPRVIKFTQKQIAEAERLIAQSIATVKRLNLDVDNEVQEMQSLLTEAKTALAALKDGKVEGEEIAEYVQDNIADKISDIRDLAARIRAALNVRQYINRVSADLKRYEARIRRLERDGQKMTEAYEFLADAKTQLADLRALAVKRLTADTSEVMIASLREIDDKLDQLAELLKLTTPDDLEQQLRRLFEGGAEKIQPFKVDQIEAG